MFRQSLIGMSDLVFDLSFCCITGSMLTSNSSLGTDASWCSKFVALWAMNVQYSLIHSVVSSKDISFLNLFLGLRVSSIFAGLGLGVPPLAPLEPSITVLRSATSLAVKTSRLESPL